MLKHFFQPFSPIFSSFPFKTCMPEWLLNSNAAVQQWLDYLYLLHQTMSFDLQTPLATRNNAFKAVSWDTPVPWKLSSSKKEVVGSSLYLMGTNLKPVLRCLFSCPLWVTVSSRSHKLNADRHMYFRCYQSTEKSPWHFLKWTRRLVIIPAQQ